MRTNCYVVRVNICHVGIASEFQASASFVVALNNQRYLLVRSRAAVGHQVMQRCIDVFLLTCAGCDLAFRLSL